MMLIATNMATSASKEVAYNEYRKLSLLSAYVGENKGRNEWTRALSLRRTYGKCQKSVENR
jgi:hypothetical protein